MESLKGYGKNQEGEVEDNHKRLLGRWSYFELQKDIEYKAAMVGIQVKYINLHTPARLVMSMDNVEIE